MGGGRGGINEFTMPPINIEGKENYKFTIFEKFIIITDSARIINDVKTIEWKYIGKQDETVSNCLLPEYSLMATTQQILWRNQVKP